MAISVCVQQDDIGSLLDIMYVWSHIYSKSIDQPGKVANPARGPLNRENEYFPSPFAPENLVSRDEFGRSVPLQPVHHVVFIWSHIYSKSIDQPGKVANPARGPLNRENEYFPIPVRA